MSTRNRRLWWAAGGTWAVLLVVLGVWSAMRGPATIRDQSTIGSAKGTVDGVVAQVQTLAPQGWQIDDSGYLDMDCALTPMRDGQMSTRLLTLSGPDGAERAALSALADGLDGARQRPDGGFYYDAGNFVAVRGNAQAPGIILVELKTGCRGL